MCVRINSHLQPGELPGTGATKTQIGYTKRMILLNDTDRTVDTIKRVLLAHGVRPTSQRVEIAKVLLREPQHLSADQVLARVNVQRPLVSKATIYNTLNLFAGQGLIRQVIIDAGKVFYDSNTDVHHHFYNEDTGMLQDVDASTLKIDRLPKLPEGTQETGIDVIVRIRNKP
jgi:Fur family iron response transcriptional regulator